MPKGAASNQGVLPLFSPLCLTRDKLTMTEERTVISQTLSSLRQTRRAERNDTVGSGRTMPHVRKFDGAAVSWSNTLMWRISVTVFHATSEPDCRSNWPAHFTDVQTGPACDPSFTSAWVFECSAYDQGLWRAPARTRRCGLGKFWSWPAARVATNPGQQHPQLLSFCQPLRRHGRWRNDRLSVEVQHVTEGTSRSCHLTGYLLKVRSEVRTWRGRGGWSSHFKVKFTVVL